MKVENLMVGDWVMRIDVENPYPVQIYEILAEGVFVDNQNNHYINLPYSDIESIPLTSEIIKKNANRHYNEHIYDIYCFFNEKNNFNELVEITLINGLFSWSINGYEYAITEIKYIHELQHVLKLCKIDKEIVL